MRTSYSALGTFQICPLKYKFQEIDKIKTPKRAEQVFGTIVHTTLKYMFERDPLYPTADQITDFYTRKWREAAKNILWKIPETKEREEKMYFEEGLKILLNFFKKNQPWNYNAVELESRFSVNIKDPRNEAEHSLVGVIDRIDKKQDSDIYEIIDYKTGKKMPSQEMLEDNLQIGLYGLAISSRWPHIEPENISGSLYFLKHNDKVSINLSVEKLERVKKRIISAINEIERRVETKDFEPTPGPLCGWCDFRQNCPMWAHEYKNDKDRDLPDEKEVAGAIDDFFAIKAVEAKNKNELARIRKIIIDYMDGKGLERVFGNDGYITRTTTKRLSFDMEKARQILEPLHKWDDVLTPDTKKMEKLLPILPENIQERILNVRSEKDVVMLKQTKK